jgi:hypothetical protein
VCYYVIKAMAQAMKGLWKGFVHGRGPGDIKSVEEMALDALGYYPD